MSAVPGDLDTDRQPPMTVPLRHFLVGLVLLIAGGLAGFAETAAARIAHVHLLLAGWICVTIMGAMTQFVPVWSGTSLHSRRLAAAQLWLVAVGLAGFAAGWLAGRPRLLPAFGALMVLGFWTFVYNVGRTLAGVDGYDVTEFHFAVALGFFLAVTGLGFLLAVDLVHPVFVGGVTRAEAVAAHATLAVFGAVLTTVLGALYQLATMFTQSDLRGIDLHVRRFERVGYPLGVVALAGGRLLSNAALARLGGALVAGSMLAFAAVLARRLRESQVPRTPMLSRYAVVAAATAAWALLALPAWLADPLAPAATFGAPGTVHLLLLGVVGFVVLGTLYHVVPFVVWVHRYSDRLGLESVPMVDDLYRDRIAAADFALLLGGTAGVVAGAWLDPRLVAAGGALVLAGSVLFAANLALVVRDHGPHSLVGLLFGIGTGDDGPASG